MKEQIVNPCVGNFIKSLRDIGYNFEIAVADVIDNSITANAKQIKIYAKSNPEISFCIIDDGFGMTEEELMEAMRLAGKDPSKERKEYDLGFTIENIVYLELLRRGYIVNVGRLDTTEVDFIARKKDIYTYFQVTASMVDKTTFEREMRPLQEIKDNYEKIVLTLDQFSLGNYDGIKVINVIDWLLEN